MTDKKEPIFPTREEQDSYRAGYKSYGNTQLPNWLMAKEHGRTFGDTPEQERALTIAYREGWKAAKPVTTFWQDELSHVDAETYGAKVKVVGNAPGFETKWLQITPEQFEKLSAFLLTIEGN